MQKQDYQKETHTQPTYRQDERSLINSLATHEKQGKRLWDIINTLDIQSDPTYLDQLLQIANILDDHVNNIINLYFQKGESACPEEFKHLANILQFYTTQELHFKQVRYSSASLYKQLFTKTYVNPNISNYYASNTMPEIENTIGTVEPQSEQTQVPVLVSPNEKQTFFVNNTRLSTLAELISKQLQKDQASTLEVGNQ